MQTNPLPVEPTIIPENPPEKPKLNLDRIRQFLHFYKQLSRNQKVSLAAFVFMIFAIPMSVVATLNEIRSRSQAAYPVTAPITPPGPSPTPTPLSSPTPIPSPTLKPKPTRKPKPTSTPSPTPIPVPSNNPPEITTTSLPIGYQNSNYSANITGRDPDLTDGLRISAGNLPSGLSLTNCNQHATASANIVSCQISGQPKKTGTYPVNVTITDSFNASRVEQFMLTVEPRLNIQRPIRWILDRVSPSPTN